MLLETKCAVFATGYTEFDMQRDYEFVKSSAGGEVDLLMEPGENRFRSLRWDLNDMVSTLPECFLAPETNGE